MQETYSPRNANFIANEKILQSARSGYLENSSLSDQRQEDLQLLIRAHERIRQLQEENFRLRDDNDGLQKALILEENKSTKLSKENTKLQQVHQQLLGRIIQLQKQLNRLTIRSNQKELVEETTENFLVFEENPVTQTLQRQQINIEKQQQGSKRSLAKQSEKVLKQSESTPVILNINVNPFSKEERDQFLSSCKQEFAQELSKIKSPEQVAPKRHLARNNSEYFLHTSPLPNQNSKILISKNSDFLKHAEQQFMDQNSKTVKNIYRDVNAMDRKKSTSSTSGSLIKKNFIGKRYDNGERTVFGERTNVWNSKYASIDQILSGTKEHQSFMKNSSSGLKVSYPSEHRESFGVTDTENLLSKNPQKSVYYKSEFSKSLYSSKDKLFDMNKDKKKKQVRLELRNGQVGGIIKYRGLCL